MASKKKNKIGLQCSVCKSTNYVTTRNKVNTPDALVMQKYCNTCKKHTEHKEKKKLD